MEDDDSRHTPGPRPPTALNTSFRRVPGSFDEDEISPVKESFDDASVPAPSGPSTTPAAQPRTQPVGNESSYVEMSSLDSAAQHSDSQAEIAVRNHLQDVESSFAAPPSPLPTHGDGVDDTFVFDSPSKRPNQARRPPLPTTHETADESLDPPSPRQPPRPGPDGAATRSPHPDTDAHHDNTTLSNTSALEAFSSSPTATALVSRTVSRAHAAAAAHTGAREEGNADPTDPSSRPRTDAASDRPLRHATSDRSLRRTSTTEAGSTPGHALRAGRRPKYLRSRNASQRSSVSSFTTDPDSDVTVGLGTDYALQSGGALPALSTSRSASNLLTRSISMGSMASGIDDLHDAPGPGFSLGGLATLDESPRRPPNAQRDDGRGHAGGSGSSGGGGGGGGGDGGDDYGDDDDNHEDHAALQTPRAAEGRPSSLPAPSDTVIARHIRNVQVPESLAKEYKTRNGLVTPRKPSDFGAMGGTGKHGGRNLTLKEQSSTIERLSKENFDLKLKVMFLSDRLDKLSEEGVKEMISENVELKTGLAVLQRDNKVLRRRVKELERQLKDEDQQQPQRPGTSRSGVASEGGGLSGPPSDQQEAQEREEELVYLRERVEEYETEVERLRAENMHKEAEKRRMAEVVKSLGEKAVGENLGRQEEADVWKDLLEQETARREQADDDNRRLRDEVFRLKQEMSALAAAAAASGLHHTTNIYHITKKQRGGDRDPPPPASPTRPVSAFSGAGAGEVVDAGSSAAALSASSVTLIEELRRESEQLRHENAELRREVGAQTSMLTSRNREKERLYQEIEDLKMAQRRGGGGPAPSTVDSILERSASRAGAHHERSQSRASVGTRATGAAGGGAAATTVTTAMDEAERDELEAKMAEARDRNNELKLQNQDLQRELNACMEDFETAVEAKRQAEELAAALQEDLEAATNDLVALQAERDEALQEQAALEAEFEALRREAQEEIDALEGEADQRSEELQRLRGELGARAEDFAALQEEMRRMSEALVRLEDEQAGKGRRIQQLEQELGVAHGELEELEAKLREAHDKAQRLAVQQESSQGEIAFLREEQEGDKMRIGDLEAAVAQCEQALRDERERARELEQRLAAERQQREMVANREKEEVQQLVNELNREASAARDEARRLRKSLRSRELEATEWKERLTELENNLREALGDLNGTRSSLLKSIAKLQRELEDTVRELDAAKASLVEKDNMIKQRDALLESHGLESRKLAELLDKERQAHRNTKHQFETFQRTHQHVSRTVSTQDARILELEGAKAQDRRRLAQLEAEFREQLTERNNLLLVLWTRLSALCGRDWAHDHSLINGLALPSLEAVGTMLPGFSKNLLAAVQTIEGMMGGFRTRIQGVERDLWKEYQALEHHLEVRSKRLERLEALVRSRVASGALLLSGLPSGGSGGGGGGGGGDLHAKLARLEEEYRRLKIENHTLRTAAEVRARAAAAYSVTTMGGDGVVVGGGGGGGAGGDDMAGSPAPSVPTGPRDRARSSRIPKSGGGGGGGTRTLSRATSSHGALPLPSSTTTTTTTPTSATTAAEDDAAGGPDDAAAGDEQQPQPQGRPGSSMENKWLLRLRDLEYKLKAEREARLLDRGEALKRIKASESENQALRENLEREKRRQGR